MVSVSMKTLIEKLEACTIETSLMDILRIEKNKKDTIMFAKM